MSNEFDDAVAASLQPSTAQAARVGFATALGTDPDAYAEAQRVARRTGVPLATVFAMPEEIKRQDTMGSVDFDALAQNSPATAALLSDVDIAKLTHDDVANMGRIEETLRALGSFGAGTVKSIVSAVPRFNEGAWGVAQAGAELLPEVIGGPMAAEFAQMRRHQKNIADGLLPKSGSLVESSWYSGMQSLGLNLLQLPLGVSGKMAPVLTSMGLTTGGQSYGEARDKGRGVGTSLAFGTSQGVIEAGTEMIGMPALFGMLKPGQFGAKAMEYLVKEQGGEQIATHLQDLNEWAVLNPQKTFSDYIDARPGAAIQTALATAFGGGGQVAVMKGVQLMVDRGAKVQQAEHGAEFVAQLNELTAASKVLQRDPATFEQFVAQAAENGPVQHVFIDAQTLAQSGVAEQLAAALPTVAAQLPDALASGGQIAIPVAEYAARIAPTEYAPALLEHLRTDPEGFSRAEAQQYLQSEQAQELQQEVARVLTEKHGDDTFKESVESVRSSIKAQLDTAARFTPQVNDAYSSLVASFYGVTAAKAGMTPEAMMQRYPLRITAEGIVGPQFDQAAKAYDGTLADLAQHMQKNPADNGWFVDIGRTNSEDAAARVKEKTGIDIGNARLLAMASDVQSDVRDHPNLTHADWQKAGELLDSADRVGRSIAQRGAQGERITLTKDIGDGETIGAVFEVLNSGKHGRRLLLKTYFKDDTASVKNWFDSNTREKVDAGLTAAGGDSRLPNNPGEGPNRTFPASDNSIDGSFEQGNRGAYSPAASTITLLKNADLSTFLHEAGHHFLEMTADLATQQDAPVEVRQDFDTLLQWFGVPDAATWHNLDFEEKRHYHEQFARGFELYLMEGQAPSIEMQGVFQRFRAWLLNVYKSLKSLNVELSDEVRSVFDRMLATGEQINLAEQGRSMLPLFASPEQAGMTAEEFAAYHALGVDATSEAIQDLQARGMRDMQWMHNARSRTIKALQQRAKGVRAEMEIEARREVMSQPIYRAWQFLTGKLTEDSGEPKGRLALDSLHEMGLPVEVVNTLKARRMAAKEGLHPDMVAEMFGFTSGDELVRKLSVAETPREEIDALTDLRMIERYGELSSPEAIAKAADRAIHNDVRSRMVATEANALEKATGQRRTLASAAKVFAAQTIARLKVRDIKPGQYASAEVRAAKATEKARKAGDLALAAAEKRNQLVQTYATRAAYDALDEIDAGLRYLGKFDNDTTRRKLDTDYTDQIDALLERFDLRKGQSLKAINKRTALATWVESQREAGLEPDISPDMLNEAFRKSYKDMTVEEFRGLLDTIKQVEHLGRLKHTLLTARDQRAYEAVRDEIAASIHKFSQGREADTRTPTTNVGRAVQGLKRFWASHIKAATWARVMDGGRDGGAMWEYFVRSANERGDRETTMRAEATGKLSEILAPVFALGKMGGKGQFFPSIGRSLNREARIALALNTGNEGNLQRLLGGEGWNEQQIGPVLQTLTLQEWAAVQAVWDHFESYRPQIAEKERRIYGKEPEWVAPGSAITAHFGVRGGYYPIKYDPAASQRAEEHADAEGAKRQLQGAYTTATTRRSFTKSRVEEVSGRPLLYTLSGLYSGVNDVIHDLAWHEWLIDANRLLRSKTIDGAMREHYGPEAKQQFKTWVADVAEGEKGADAAVDMALSRLRQGVSAAGLGFNVMSALIQPLGITQSITRVGAEWVGRGVVKYLAHPLDATREANGKSSFMENRARTRFRELNELRNQVQDQSAFKENIGRYAYFLMMRCQQMVDVPTWHGAYEKAIAAGNDEARAIALADQAVIDAQGGGQTKDLSAIERGGPAQKLFTVFYSFMNTALNVGIDKTMSADTSAKRAKLAVDYAMLYVAPAILGYFLKAAITPGDSGDDDLEKIAKKLAANQIDYLMGLMVVVREFGEAAKLMAGANDMGRDYTGPAGLRLVADSVSLAKQAHQGEFDDAFRKAAVNVVGDLFGLPSAQINRTITGTKALVEGKTNNPAAIGFGFQEKR